MFEDITPINKKLSVLNIEEKYEYDFEYGPRYQNEKWMLGNVDVEFDNENIIIGSKTFKSTPGLQRLIFYKNPCDFTILDHQNYKQILELSNVHRNSRGYLRSLANKKKFDSTIRPLFKNKTKSKATNNKPLQQSNICHQNQENFPLLNEKEVEEEKTVRHRKESSILQEFNETTELIMNWTHPGQLVDRLRKLVKSNGSQEEIELIITELRNEEIIY